MPIFRNESGRLKKLNFRVLAKEKSLQQLLEENLPEVLNVHFLATEYPTTFGGRIDTLAVDASGAPVIIEYKRNRNDNVINQALSYLKWLKTQKRGFFEKLIIDKLGAEVAKTIDLDWHNPRVICIAESYSKFDIDTVEVVPLRIELFRYRYYEDNVFSLEPINVAEDVSPPVITSSVKISTQGKQAKEVSFVSEASIPSAEMLLDKATPATQELFQQLRERIHALDDAVVEKLTRQYVAFRLSNTFAEVHITRDHLKIHLRSVEYVDPRGLIEKVPENWNWTLNRRVYFRDLGDLDYIAGIVEQSYRDVL